MDSQIVSLDAEKKKLENKIDGIEKEIDGIKNKISEYEADNKRYIANIVATKDKDEITKLEVINDFLKFKLYYIKLAEEMSLYDIVSKKTIIL